MKKVFTSLLLIYVFGLAGRTIF